MVWRSTLPYIETYGPKLGLLIRVSLASLVMIHGYYYRAKDCDRRMRPPEVLTSSRHSLGGEVKPTSRDNRVTSTESNHERQCYTQHSEVQNNLHPFVPKLASKSNPACNMLFGISTRLAHPQLHRKLIN